MRPRLLIEEISTPLTALQVFELLREEPFCFFLDSGMDPTKLGRYSFVGSRPFMVLKSQGDKVSLLRGGRWEIIEGDPFDILRGFLERFSLESGQSPIPFVGGTVGYFGYDFCNFL